MRVGKKKDGAEWGRGTIQRPSSDEFGGRTLLTGAPTMRYFSSRGRFFPFARANSKSATPPRADGYASRLRLEPLEDRRLLADFTVTTTTDGGPAHSARR